MQDKEDAITRANREHVKMDYRDGEPTDRANYITDNSADDHSGSSYFNDHDLDSESIAHPEASSALENHQQSVISRNTKAVGYRP